MRPSGEDEAADGRKFDLSRKEGTNFSLSHKHSGLQGDGQRVKAAFLDASDPYVYGDEPLYQPANAPTSGRTYRIQIVEVTDPETQQVSPVIQVVPG